MVMAKFCSLCLKTREKFERIEFGPVDLLNVILVIFGTFAGWNNKSYGLFATSILTLCDKGFLEPILILVSILL